MCIVNTGLNLSNVLGMLITLVAGALAVFLGYWLKYRIPVVGVKQYISRVIDPGMLIKPHITFESNQHKFHYPNLYIVETHFFNQSRKAYKKFDLKVELKVPAEIIYIACNGEDGSHEIVPKQAIDFENPAKCVDLDIDPFNRDNVYSISLYVTCTGDEELTRNSIHYSTKIASKFVSING